MAEASTSACAEAFLSSWVSCFSVPDSTTMDRGPAFLSELWVTLACLIGTTLHSMTAYNPASKGMVERAHCSLKAALMARCINDNWKAQLPWILLGLCAALRADGDVSPAEKACGETLAVPREFFPTALDSTDTSLPRLREVAQKFVPCQKTFCDRTHVYSPGGPGYLHPRLHQDRRPPPTLDQTVQGPIPYCQQIIEGLSHQHPWA
ncbi:uncharacterized protein [Macrobrachium rosenbergii]|uniref:uncharacterized protein n=1 Tax=Macrobrachium rosenbergii TaxID=79674 RepID=UPI0034D56B5E